MQRDLAARVVAARAVLQEKGALLPDIALASELRGILEPLVANIDTLEFGARRKLLRICKAFDRMETHGLDRGGRVGLDIDLLGLWVRIG